MKNDIQSVLRVKGVKSQGFGIIPKLAMRDKRLPIESKAIYAYLCSFAGAGNVAFPSVSLMCDELGVSETRYSKYRKYLEKYGYLTIERQKEGNLLARNIYEICDNPEEQVHMSVNSRYHQIRGIENEGIEIGGIEIGGIENKGTINNSSYNQQLYNQQKEKKVSKKEETVSLDSTKSFNEIIDEYITDKHVKEALIEFIKMRKLIKKPMTNRALKNIISKLFEYTRDPETQILHLEQSITNSWAGIFPIKEDGISTYQNNGRGKTAEQTETISNPFLRKLQRDGAM